jgi:hypothetical protein
MWILCAAISLLLLTACGITNPPTPDRAGQVLKPWVLSGLAGNRLELGVMVMGADCERFADVEVIESDQNVEVRAWVAQLRTDACYAVRGYLRRLRVRTAERRRPLRLSRAVFTRHVLPDPLCVGDDAGRPHRCQLHLLQRAVLCGELVTPNISEVPRCVPLARR